MSADSRYDGRFATIRVHTPPNSPPRTPTRSRTPPPAPELKPANTSMETESDGDGDDEAVIDDAVPVIPSDGSEEHGDRCCQCRWMHLASTLLFVIGSILYLVMSVMDYQYAVTLNTVPMYLRYADDDVTWANYQAHGPDSNADASLAATSGGVRRMKTREYRRLREAEEEERAEAAALEMVAKLASQKKVQRKEEGVAQDLPGAARRVTAKAAKRAAKAATRTDESSGRNLQASASTPEDLYYDSCWTALPSQIQNAYAALGYNENSWDNGLETEASDTFWANLSDEERAAAAVIGYTEEMWCAGDEDDEVVAAALTAVVETGRPTMKLATPSPTEQPTIRPATGSPVVAEATAAAASTTLFDEQWEDLSPEAQVLYAKLGYDEVLWNSGSKLPIDEQTWDELSWGARLTINAIGFDEVGWDSIAPGGHFPSQPASASVAEDAENDVVSEQSSPTLAPAKPVLYMLVTATPASSAFVTLPIQASVQSVQSPSSPIIPDDLTDTTSSVEPQAPAGPTPEELYYNECWTDLPEDIQAAYMVLGFDENKWDNAIAPEESNAFWDDLSPEMQEAALSIGYTKEAWDSDPGETDVDELTVNEPVVTPESALSTIDTSAAGSPSGPEIVNAVNDDTGEVESPDIVDILDVPTTTTSTSSAPTTASPVATSVQNNVSQIDTEDSSVPDELPQSESSAPVPYNVTDAAAPEPVAPAEPTPEELYYEECWTDLPQDIQAAYAVLGFDENKWTNAIVPEESNEYWDDLSPEMREAALFIGYTKEAWDADPEETDEDDPAVTPDLASSPAGTSVLNNSNKPDMVNPNEEVTVPGSVQNDVSPTDTEETSTLDQFSQSDSSSALAPATLTDSTTGEPTAPTGPTPDELYHVEAWFDLPQEIQAGYAVLGYDENMWCNAIVPEAVDVYWDELSPQMQEAALFIGYTKEAWDADPGEASVNDLIMNDPALLPTNNSVGGSSTGPLAANPTKGGTDGVNNPEAIQIGYYDNYGWAELPPDIRGAAAALGYNEQLWDMGGVVWSEDYWWDELPSEAQAAAASFGFNEQLWNTGGNKANGYASFDDDYVFQFRSSNVWVSQYQIIYFFAALSFVFVGVLDLIQERHAFHILMTLAGLCGVISAVYIEADIRLSNAFSCVSVHLFLFEAIAMFREYKRRSSISMEASKWMKLSMKLGDLEFVVGALLDLILSYFYIFDDTSDWDVPMMVVAIVAAVLWLHCSLIYVGAFFYYPKAKQDSSVTVLRKDTAEATISHTQRNENDLL